MKTIIFICLFFVNCLAYSDTMSKTDSMSKLPFKNINQADKVLVLGTTGLTHGEIKGVITDKRAINEIIEGIQNIPNSKENVHGRFASDYELNLTFIERDGKSLKISIVADSVVILESEPAYYYEYDYDSFSSVIRAIINNLN